MISNHKPVIILLLKSLSQLSLKNPYIHNKFSPIRLTENDTLHNYHNVHFHIMLYLKIAIEKIYIHEFFNVAVLKNLTW